MVTMTMFYWEETWYKTIQGEIIMADTLKGRYYLVAAEAGGQDMMEMMEQMAATMGKRAAELMCFDFSGNGKVTMQMMDEKSELDYTVEGNTVKLDAGEEKMELHIEGNTLKGTINGTNAVFSDTLPKEDESEGESGAVTHALTGITVTLTLPEKGWCTERDLAAFATPTLFLYKAPSLRKKGFFAPSIEFITHNSVSEFDLVFSEGFKNRKETGSRNIGGIDMKGRRWSTDSGAPGSAAQTKTESIEYIGVYGNNRGIHVQFNDLDIESDEVRTIMESIRFTGETV